MNRLFRLTRISISLSTQIPNFRFSRACSSIATMESLKVHNSLKPGQPVPFTPINPGKVSWYACGPTVYDKSHLGHARNYVSTDIIRRIMMHYFGADVKFVMNITDVDDKIIIKARRQRLLELEKQKKYSDEELAKLTLTAFRAYAEKSLSLMQSSDLDENNYLERRDSAYGKVLAGGTLTGEGKPGDDEAKTKMHIANMDAAAFAIKDKKFFPGTDEVLLPYLDSLYKETIDTSDQTIFTDLTQSMEKEFFDDMDALNCLRPDVITRVTEYVPQIASFVERIVDKGFAYESDGSVYFDITAFEKAGNTYARLRPGNRNDKSLQEDGEGALSKNLGEKRNEGDFALWKKSKKGEPYWESRWGQGRPGWHIECSVMASDILGAQMDIHSGGIDLAFPHHDNELAQSEAFYVDNTKGEHTWVNNFMHMGHLSISGSKMSKSLKNFQTIQDALATTYTSRGMRIVFLMGKWNDGVEISPDMRAQASSWEATINNYFTNVKAYVADASASTDGVESLSLSDKPTGGLVSSLEKAKADLQTALSNSFDTPQAMRVIQELVSEANKVVVSQDAEANVPALVAVARWITKILGTFGLDENANAPYDGLGWAAPASNAKLDPKTVVQPYATVFQTVKSDVEALKTSADSVSALLSQQNPEAESSTLADKGVRDPEQLALPYLRATSRLRDELRRIVSSVSPETKKAILSLTDRIRDEDLTNLGVYLDDRPDGKSSLIKFVPASELIAAKNEKLAREADKARAKEEAKRAREQAEKEKWEKAKLPHTELFKGDEKYSEWDAEGLPTKLKDGSDVPKSQLKKLQKQWQSQKKAHEEYLVKFGGKS
ncbi:tRNA synthetase class I catalytic domain-containing protein [Colletotrichum abscissum]|uniref:cysteine--tRNA ligase n=1 Tax=Colletotrichum abscissum TaxID=1671311 RepID=A0A9P9XGC7_9PEZI|nr:tRNA synthetase class I catalytic domain-containing protein [Colletotrichum abscissum]KAI3552231.1 tRNA synthetase class I catalytic domain-containing protein [Colletotrichum abscissum]KAK1516606.1 tRNA synthetase class I catalytic domain-containing protein [Colletotrichum abscissum]